MRTKKLVIISALALLPMCLFAQKKPLDHDVYNAWESVTDTYISPDGNYSVHLVSPQEGDSLLELTHLRTLATVRIERGFQPQFSSDSRTLVFRIKPSQAEKKQAQKEKKKADDMPKDSLGYILLPALSVHKNGASGGYKMPEKDAAFFAYTAPMPKDTGSNAPKDERNEYLIIHHLAKQTDDTLACVAQYAVPKSGKYVAYVTKPSAADSTALPGVYLYDLATRTSTLLREGKGEYKAPVFDEEAAQLAFYATADTTKNEHKAFDLYYASTSPVALQRLAADTLSPQMPEQWGVNPHHAPWFSRNGDKLYFGIYPLLPPRDTTVSESEKVRLDVWHYDDDYLQPFQLKQLTTELRRTHLCVFHLKQPDRFVRLGSPELIDIATADRGNSDYALGFDTRGYRKESQWTGSTRNDVYLLDTQTGEKTLLAKGMDGRPGFSTTGKYLIWFDKNDAQWYLHTIATNQTRCLTQGLGVEFKDARREVPDLPGSFGAMGWSRDDRLLYLYDMYDIWQFDPSGQAEPQCLTKGYGREHRITFRNVRLTDEYEYVDDKKPFLLSAFDNRTKENGIFTLAPRKNVKQLAWGKCTFSTPVRAKNANVFIYTKSDFRTSPDLWTTADWKQETQISHINPQMKEYLWGTPELVYWTSKDGFELEGILYKPEGFDPEKKYPLLIYFYEKHADELYRYFAPMPSRSIINIPFFCSRGYLVFTPNIHYVDGHPGRSAYNSIVAGAEALCQYPWVDKEHMGIQGQSWGGYQVAYLITQTNMFAAAGAGAPVSNMTSAYGGIRWSTGLNRQMQYERQQSRIGKTLWEGFDLYIENSPLFFADKVETPLLMTHNDNDGAVPWYQGIEYFTALRRLDKTVWLLQYNGEEHNLTQRRNMRDLSVRLQQYFDHYLQGAAMPVWMKDGIPAIQKGRTYGLELTEEEEK
jgi:dipeptidyl aminopeptidase/acylaminoacyl peptidase